MSCLHLSDAISRETTEFPADVNISKKGNKVFAFYEISVDEGIKLALSIFKEILGKTFSVERFDVGYIEKTHPKIKKISNDGLKKYLK